MIGLINTDEFSAEERVSKDGEKLEYDEGVTLIEQFEYLVRREQNRLRIFKTGVEGECQIEGLCSYRKENEKQNLKLHVYQLDMFTIQVEAMNITKHNTSLYNFTLVMDTVQIKSFKSISIET